MAKTQDEIRADNRDYWKVYRAKHLLRVRMTQRLANKKYRSKPENKIKRNARRKVEYELFMGRLKRGKCRKRGCKNLKTQAHHDNHKKKLQIKWFCALHHREYERKMEIR